MVLIRKSCFCFTPRTGTALLGCMGILLAVLSMVPNILLLQDHEFYLGEFVKKQRAMGVRDISDNDIPKISYFSRLTWSIAVAYEVIFTFASILLLAGVSAERRYLLLPWLSVIFVTFMLGIILVLALMFSFANNIAVVIFLASAPVVAAVVYLWITVYSTFHQMKTETGGARCTTSSSFSSSFVRSQATSASVQDPSWTTGGATTTIAPTSAIEGGDVSQSSLISGSSSSSPTSNNSSREIPPLIESTSMASLTNSIRMNLRKAIHGSPPPTYESVTIDIGKEKEALAAGLHHTALTFETPREDSEKTNKNRGKKEKDSEDDVTPQTDDTTTQNVPSVRVQEVDSIVVCADGG